MDIYSIENMNYHKDNNKKQGNIMKAFTAIATIAPIISILLSSELKAASSESQKTDTNLKIQVKNLMNRINELESKKNVVGLMTEKEAVTSGNPLNLKLSGAVNRAVQWHDNGRQSNTVHVDGINDTFTNFALEATGKVSDDKSVGSIIEVGVASNAPENIDVHSANDTTISPSISVVDLYLQSKSWGTITLGYGDFATTRVMFDADLSNTEVIGAGVTAVQQGAGTVFFDKLSKAKGTTTGAASLSILEVFNASSESGNRILYDTPTYWGTQISTSHTYIGRNDSWDIALRHASDIGDTKVAAQLGYFKNAYNTGGGSSENIPAKYQQWAGSVGVLCSWGASLMFAAAHRNWDINKAPDGKIYYGKLGYQRQFFEAGMTAFAVDYGYFKNLTLNRSATGASETMIHHKFVGKTYGLFLVQYLDRIATEIYLSGRIYGLDGEKSSSPRYRDITVVTSGLRVQF